MMLMVELPAKEYEKFLEESVNLKETVLRQKKEICELKKQLVESEERNKRLEVYKFYSANIVKDYADKCKSYEQQLAESEKEIERLKKLTKKLNHEAQTYYEDAYCNDFQTKAKTEFAIQQLQRVKKFCENWKCYTEDINYVIVEEKNGIRCVPTLYEEIDKIIKELEGEK